MGLRFQPTRGSCGNPVIIIYGVVGTLLWRRHGGTAGGVGSSCGGVTLIGSIGGGFKGTALEEVVIVLLLTPPCHNYPPMTQCFLGVEANPREYPQGLGKEIYG